jgi:hypothetical protein
MFPLGRGLAVEWSRIRRQDLSDEGGRLVAALLPEQDGVVGGITTALRAADLCPALPGALDPPNGREFAAPSLSQVSKFVIT